MSNSPGSVHDAHRPLARGPDNFLESRGIDEIESILNQYMARPPSFHLPEETAAEAAVADPTASIAGGDERYV